MSQIIKVDPDIMTWAVSFLQVFTQVFTWWVTNMPQPVCAQPWSQPLREVLSALSSNAVSAEEDLLQLSMIFLVQALCIPFSPSLLVHPKPMLRLYLSLIS